MPSLIPKARHDPFEPEPLRDIPVSEDFRHGEDSWKRIVHISRTELDATVGRKAFFTLGSLADTVVRKIRKELSHNIGDDPRIEDFAKEILNQLDVVQVEESNYMTTRRMLNWEKVLIAMTKDETTDHVLPEEVVEEAIRSLIKKDADGNIIEQMTEEQIRAVHACTLFPNRTAIVEGAPGAGKSHTMRAINRAFTAMGYDVIGTAIAYTAAQNLAKSAGIKGDQQALSNYVAMLENTVGNQGIDLFRKKTVMIVDEGGMVDTLTMAKLLWYTKLNHAGVKIIVTGDSLQLNPVAAGNALELMVDRSPNVVRISKIRRQRQESHREFVELLSQRVSGRALYCLEQQESLHWCANKKDLIRKVVQDYLTFLYNNPGKTSIIMTTENKDVQAINEEIRRAYKELGWIKGEEIYVNATDTSSPPVITPFAIGDQVVIRSNDKTALVYKRQNPMPEKMEDWEVDDDAQGIFNRYTGCISGVRRNSKGERLIVVDLYGEEPGTWTGTVCLNTASFKAFKKQGFPVVHNFGSTIYSAQGQTVDQAFLIHSCRTLNSRLALVGASRHRDGLDVYLDETEISAYIDNKDRDKKKPKKFIRQEQSLKYGDSPPEIPVTRDRYTKSDMLHAVANVWSKENANQTVNMLIKDLHYGKQQINVKHLLKLTWDAVSKETKKAIPVLDFCKARLEKRTPVVDVETLLKRAEVKEAPLVGPTKVERHNLGDTPDMELLDVFTNKPANPFAAKRKHEDLDIENPTSHVSTTERRVYLKAPEEILLNNPEVTEVPFIESIDKGLGYIDEQGKLVFDNDDSTVKNSQIREETIQNLKHEFWEVGRYSEPRIIATDSEGLVVSRYRIDGTCVSGDGYPPMLISEHGDEKSNILIVPGVKEALVALQSFSDKYKDDKVKIPHFIWAAKDCDWKPLSEFLRVHEGKIIIVRSKIDERQVEWANKLNSLLRNTYKVDVSVQPPIPMDYKSKTTKSSSNKIKP